MSEKFYNEAMYFDDIPKEKWKDYVGDGYRSCYYTNDNEKHGRIIFLGFDKTGNRKTFVFPWKPHICYVVGYKTETKDAFGRYVAYKYFDNKQHRDNYVKNANGMTVIECLRPETEFLNFMFDENALDPNFNKQKLRIQTIDIETEIDDTAGFMRPG